ncbi:MAG: triacylglycerol lipase [Myxococcota bacterium]
MPSQHQVYLIPGLFGFGKIGQITYFNHVRELIEAWFKSAGESVAVHGVATSPTASIRTRAAEVYASIQETADDDGPIHLIGHSTGGLDARLFVTPNAALKIEPDELEALAARVRTVTTVATPNHGAPVAGFFSSAMGSQLLGVVSLVTLYTLKYGKLPLGLLVRLGGVLTRLDDLIGLRGSVLDQLYEHLLDEFDTKRQGVVKEYFASVGGDNAALGQLTPGGIDLLNAATEDRPGVRYGCVVMKASDPGWQTVRAIGFDPYRQASNLVYRFLKWVGTDEASKYPDPTPQQDRMLTDRYGQVPGPTQTDGIVPTRSQLWGELVYAGRGDHLDVCGHFDDVEHDPPHYDWLATGSGFDRAQFESLWGAVTDFLMRTESAS